MKNNILITGYPNIGKTTLIKRIQEQLDCKIGGFVTYSKEENGKRTGFYIEDFEGQRMTMAEIGLKSPFRVSHYGVSIESFEKIGIPSLIDAKKNADLVLIDEIGTMETFSNKFCEILIEIFSSSKPLLATIKKKNSTFTKKLKERDDVLLFNLGARNRDSVERDIIKYLEQQLCI